MRRVRPRTRLVPVLLVLLLAGGCTTAEEEPPEVRVSGGYGDAPALRYTTPLVVAEALVEIVWEGNGPRLADGAPVLVDFWAESGEDASLIGETYSSEPKGWLLSAEAVGSDIHRALTGRTVGTRVLHVVPPEHAGEGSTVAVYDILPTRATGEPVDGVREGLPAVELGDDGEPRVVVPEGPPPSELVVQPLLRGTGPQVQAGQVITVQYTGVAWSDGRVFDSSWEPGRLPAPFPIGVGSVLPGWDEGLLEQTVGSQVMLVVPPALGYQGSGTELEDETLVFVVDILAARGGPRED